MTESQDAELPPPVEYQSPKGRVEKRLLRWIFHVIFGGAARTDRNGHVVLSAAEEIFVIAPPRLWPAIKMFLMPALHIGEQFIRGRWYLIQGDMTGLLRFCYINATDPYRRFFRITSGFRGLRHHFAQTIFIRNLTRRVRSHYDVDSKLYELFLDKEMLYTCAFYERPRDTLEQAQKNKLNRALERLHLPCGELKILDIGCGWGGTARHIVRQHPSARVTGLTISRSQLTWASKYNDQNISDSERQRIRLLEEDYLDHDCHSYYDRVIVIGMMEHVGLGDYATFFDKIFTFLKKDGIALIHTIVCGESERPTNHWIDRYIFPGGYAPSPAEILRAAEGRLALVSVYLHDGENYVKTIRDWKYRFMHSAPVYQRHLLSQGRSEKEIGRFMRKWHFYLSSVENMFVPEFSDHQVAQVVFRKP